MFTARTAVGGEWRLVETADSERRRGPKVGCPRDQRQMGVFLAAKWIKSGCKSGLRFLSPL